MAMFKKFILIAGKEKSWLVTHLIRFGIVTLIVNKWSPRIDGLFNLGTPRLARTTRSPGWVPGGIWSSVVPSTVFTCLIQAFTTNKINRITDMTNWIGNRIRLLNPLFKSLGIARDKINQIFTRWSYGWQLQSLNPRQIIYVTNNYLCYKSMTLCSGIFINNVMVGRNRESYMNHSNSMSNFVV